MSLLRRRRPAVFGPPCCEKAGRADLFQTCGISAPADRPWRAVEVPPPCGGRAAPRRCRARVDLHPQVSEHYGPSLLVRWPPRPQVTSPSRSRSAALGRGAETAPRFQAGATGAALPGLAQSDPLPEPAPGAQRELRAGPVSGGPTGVARPAASHVDVAVGAFCDPAKEDHLAAGPRAGAGSVAAAGSRLAQLDCLYFARAAGEGVKYPYEVTVTDTGHPITAGVKDFRVASEQYYMSVDPNNHVLAESTFTGEHLPWLEGKTIPQAWTRTWGRGRVFYSAVGHDLDDLQNPDVTRLCTQGFAWAARQDA
ncbi:ThuA domain-containing protein [Streptomyces tibetensis]